jgi:hypothetical protein
MKPSVCRRASGPTAGCHVGGAADRWQRLGGCFPRHGSGGSAHDQLTSPTGAGGCLLVVCCHQHPAGDRRQHPARDRCWHVLWRRGRSSAVGARTL